MTTIYF